MMNTQLGSRVRYADRRRNSTFKTATRVIWKSKSRHIA